MIKAVLRWVFRIAWKTGMVKRANAIKLTMGKKTSKTSTINFHHSQTRLTVLIKLTKKVG